MGSVGYYAGVALTALGIKLPHHLGIGVKRLRRSHLFHATATPQSIGAAESGQPTLGADSSAGQHEQAIARQQRLNHRLPRRQMFRRDPSRLPNPDTIY